MAGNTLSAWATTTAVLTLLPLGSVSGQTVGQPLKPVTAAPVIMKPLPTKPLSRPLPAEVKSPVVLTTQNVVLAKPVLVPRPNTTDARMANAQLVASNVKIRERPKMTLVAVAQLAGIHRVNGRASGVMEPGGDYEIGGSGFGAGNGSVFVRHGGRILPMRITHWSDGQIFASLPGDISELPDAGSVELSVGPAGKAVFTTKKFGFRAARADVPLAITDAMFSYDKGKITKFMGIDVPTNRGPDKKSFEGKKVAISRYVSDDGSSKRCFEPGFDRIRTDIPLQPGFQITNIELSPLGTPNRGHYGTSWEANAARIEYGVNRDYTPKFVFVGGSGSCASHYEARLIATGPRGMPPQ